jgi:hypothetical protein
MNLYTEFILPILNGLAIDNLLTGRYFLKFLIVIGTSFSAFVEAAEWLLAGYIDVIYLGDDHPRSYTRVVVFLATPILSRLLVLLWKIICILFSALCNHVALVSSLALPVLVPWLLLSFGRSMRLSILRHRIELLAFAMPFNLTFCIIVVIVALWKRLILATATIAERLRPAPVGFSYPSAGDFDPHSQIRLLKLHKRRLFSRVSAELISCDVTAIPVYHAISYAWSHDSHGHQTITLNGMEFPVKRNVYDILERCSSFHGPHLIWIDSICINQASLIEKTLQVRRMQDIYGAAVHVIVCLGNGPAHLAFGLIAELEHARWYLGEAGLIRHVAGFRERQRTDIYLRARISALLQLLRHSWFRRVWVVQEVVVARKVTLCYGWRSMSLPDFHKKLDVISSKLISLLIILGLEDESMRVAPADMGIVSMPVIYSYRQNYRRSGPQSIIYVLRSFLNKEATVPIDKVFALLGIAKQYGQDLKQLVDYQHESPNNILLNVANVLLDNGEALHALYLAGIGCHIHNPDIPSWAVDWTTKRIIRPFYESSTWSKLIYRATGVKSFHGIRGRTRRQMIVRGILLDRIQSIARPHGIGSFNERSFTFIHSYPSLALSTARTRIPKIYHHTSPSQPLDEAVWRTLIGDRIGTQRPAPSSYGRVISSNLQFMHDTHQISGSRIPQGYATHGEREAFRKCWDEERTEQFQKDVADFGNVELLYDNSGGADPLVFGVTEKGYIGMAPQGSEVGDVIGLIYGMHIPCVLRKHKETWKFVGGAYVHGIMDSEGLEVECGEQDLALD